MINPYSFTEFTENMDATLLIFGVDVQLTVENVDLILPWLSHKNNLVKHPNAVITPLDQRQIQKNLYDMAKVDFVDGKWPGLDGNSYHGQLFKSIMKAEEEDRLLTLQEFENIQAYKALKD